MSTAPSNAIEMQSLDGITDSVALSVSKGGGIMVSLTLPSSAFNRVGSDADENGDSLTDAFRKALGLYVISVEAKRTGKTIGLVDDQRNAVSVFDDI